MIEVNDRLYFILTNWASDWETGQSISERGYTTFAEARAELDRLVAKEKLSPQHRCDTVEETESSWEAYRDGSHAQDHICFEILSVDVSKAHFLPKCGENNADAVSRHDAFFFPWKAISEYASQTLSKTLGREIEAAAWADDEQFWSIKVTNTRITPEELEQLFKVFNADDTDLEDNVIVKDDFTTDTSVCSFAMDFAYKIIAGMFPLTTVIDYYIEEDTGLWIVGDGAPDEVRLELPDGQALSATACNTGECPSLSICLESDDPEKKAEVICFAEWDKKRTPGHELCICAYSGSDEPAYYESYLRKTA